MCVNPLASVDSRAPYAPLTAPRFLGIPRRAYPNYAFLLQLGISVTRSPPTGYTEHLSPEKFCSAGIVGRFTFAWPVWKGGVEEGDELLASYCGFVLLRRSPRGMFPFKERFS